MASCTTCGQEVPAGRRWCTICHTNVSDPTVGRLASPARRLGAFIFDLIIPLFAGGVFGELGWGVGIFVMVVLWIAYVVWPSARSPVGGTVAPPTARGWCWPCGPWGSCMASPGASWGPPPASSCPGCPNQHPPLPGAAHTWREEAVWRRYGAQHPPLPGAAHTPGAVRGVKPMAVPGGPCWGGREEGSACCRGKRSSAACPGACCGP